MMMPAWAWKNAPSLSLSTCNPPANARPRALATFGSCAPAVGSHTIGSGQ